MFSIEFFLFYLQEVKHYTLHKMREDLFDDNYDDYIPKL